MILLLRHEWLLLYAFCDILSRTLTTRTSLLIRTPNKFRDLMLHVSLCSSPRTIKCVIPFLYLYTSHKNNCQKILPAHSMITKRDFILRGSCFCEKYSYAEVRYGACFFDITAFSIAFCLSLMSKTFYVLSYQLKLIKTRVELANQNHCAVPFLSRAAVSLCWYVYICYKSRTFYAPQTCSTWVSMCFWFDQAAYTYRYLILDQSINSDYFIWAQISRDVHVMKIYILIPHCWIYQ